MLLNMRLQATYAATQEVFPFVPERIKTNIKRVTGKPRLQTSESTGFQWKSGSDLDFYFLWELSLDHDNKYKIYVIARNQQTCNLTINRGFH